MRGERATWPRPPFFPAAFPTLLIPLLIGAATFAAPATGPSRPGIDIEGYRFELTLRDDTDEIAGRTTVTLRFQVQEGGLFQVPLDIGVYGEGDLVPTRVTTVEVSEAVHRFEIAVEEEPVDVRLDPETWLLFSGNLGRVEG